MRRFNEENNEEAGEHWTPRDAVRLMANLVFLPIQDRSSPAPISSTIAPAVPGVCSRWARRRSPPSAETQPAGQVPALWSGDQPRDIRRLQSRHAAQGRGRKRRPRCRRRGMVHAFARCVSRPRVRLHARQPAIRQKLEEGPRSAGRQGRNARPALQVDAQGRRILARYPFQRRAVALPRQHGLQDERQISRSAAASPRSTTVLRSSRAMQDRARATSAVGSSRMTGWRPSSRCRLTFSTTPASPHIFGCCPTEGRAPQGQGAVDRRHSMVQAAAQEPWQKELRTCARGHRAHQPHLPRLQGNRESKIFPNAAFGYWKVTVERPLRLHSQLYLKTIESLRFASGR